MNATRFPFTAHCPRCGLTIRAETTSLVGTDYWRHLASEHGMNRFIYVEHARPE